MGTVPLTTFPNEYTEYLSLKAQSKVKNQHKAIPAVITLQVHKQSVPVLMLNVLKILILSNQF